MQINTTIKGSDKYAELTITRNGYIITDIWGHDRRVITNPDIRTQIFTLKSKGKAALANASYVWEKIRDEYTEEAASAPINPALIWGKGKVNADSDGAYVPRAPKVSKPARQIRATGSVVAIAEESCRPLEDAEERKIQNAKT